MKTLLQITLLLLLSAALAEASRIKDITNVAGGRDNQLFGYGIVVGLSGAGDGSSNEVTLQSVANSLETFGVNITTDDLKSNNVAAVIVTADIGAFIKEGSRIDVTVSSIGDATTIQGGVLLQTPLQGADGVVYAVAQGSLAVGGFLEGIDGATFQKNHPTVGKIPGGAIVEREIPASVVEDNSVNLLLQHPDYATSVRMADAINGQYPGTAQAMDPTKVNVRVPDEFLGQEINFIAHLGMVEVVPDVRARVIINERTGTIVATQNVRVSKVAISHGPLTVSISQTTEVSQPNPLAPEANGQNAPQQAETGGPTFGPGGQTVAVDNAQTEVVERMGGFQVIDDLPTIDRLTAALNALGVSTREMMSIFQSLKAAGALQAELIME